MYVSWSLLLYYSYFGVDNKKKKKRVIATAATSVMSSVMVIRFVLSSSFQTIEPVLVYSILGDRKSVV